MQFYVIFELEKNLKIKAEFQIGESLSKSEDSEKFFDLLKTFMIDIMQSKNEEIK